MLRKDKFARAFTFFVSPVPSVCEFVGLFKNINLKSRRIFENVITQDIMKRILSKKRDKERRKSSNIEQNSLGKF